MMEVEYEPRGAGGTLQPHPQQEQEQPHGQQQQQLVASNTTTAHHGIPAQSTTTAVTVAEVYAVQKCWFDGPHVQPPLDCWRLWTTGDAATQFAHASAARYAQCRASTAAPSPTTTAKPVRTLLLPHSGLYGFATCGRLFWVRKLTIPLCPCLAREGGVHHPHGIGAAAVAPTALVRLHLGVLGGTATTGGAAAIGGRRVGTTESTSEDVARLDCPHRCPALQHWLQHQLRDHRACTWRRIPVGTGHDHPIEWWKEWGDWETWGQPRLSSRDAASGVGGGPTTAHSLQSDPLWGDNVVAASGHHHQHGSGGKRRHLEESGQGSGVGAGGTATWGESSGWMLHRSHNNYPNKRVATVPR